VEKKGKGCEKERGKENPGIVWLRGRKNSREARQRGKKE
jgi:hypothetical protein